jgi:hypothetical protein
MDARSNLFSLGAMFYEMVTERKAFDREDAEALRQSILDSTPVAPIHVNAKVHPLLSDLIMKALSKDPAERYQSGRELLDDLENCKESKPAGKKTEAPRNPAVPNKTSASAPAKVVAPGTAKPAPTPSNPVQSGLARPSPPVAAAPRAEARPTALATPVTKLAVPKAAAAAAGVGGKDTSLSSPELSGIEPTKEFSSSARAATIAAPETPSSYMSRAVAEEPEIAPFAPQVAGDSPKIAVDPMMAEGGAKSSSGVSFSEMTELPPLKEIYTPPPPPAPTASQAVPAALPTATMYQEGGEADEKPKVQPREVAEKAIREIKNVPPKLMLYALGGAVALILVIGIGVTIYVHSLNSDDDSGAGRTDAVSQTAAPPEASQPTAKQPPAPVEAAQPVETQPAEATETVAPAARTVASSKAARNAKKKAVAPPPAIIPGQLAVDSTPQGAQVQVDGMTDASYVTPFALTNLQPGQHSIIVSKAGYSSDTRTVNVVSGNRATTLVHLAQLVATLVVKSDPPGANIYVDGRDVGTKTPAQVSLDKGQHVVLVRRSGYIDETMNGQFALGQTLNFSPTLRSLGNADNIKTVGKMSRLFGGKGGQAGQGTVSIHTQPKGAQVAINQHMLEKNVPVDVMLDPGNYVIDVTMTGYAPLHKVITVDKGGKVAVDDIMQKE